MKKFLSLLLALAMIFALAACGAATAEEEETSADVEESTSEDSSGSGSRVLNVGTSLKSVDGFDPPVTGNEIGLDLVYDTLFVRNPDNGNAIEGLLAEAWEYTDDTTLTITLHDATFSNGDPVTAEDVLYSLKRIVDTNSQYMDYYTNIDFENSTAEDDKTLVIATYEPDPVLLAYLALPYASILNKAYVESAGDEAFWDAPVGSGPYTLTENVSGSHSSYALREDYWGDLPEADVINVYNYTDQTTMFIDFETGAVDMVFGISSGDAERLQNGEVDGATLMILSNFNSVGLALPEYTEAFSDIRVRQAVAEALDIDAITEIAYGILGTPAASVVAKGMDYYIEASGNRYDPEHAQQLLEEAGYGNGLSLRMVICQVDFQEKISEAVQAMLAEVGIELSIEEYDIPTAVGMFMEGDTDIVINAQSCIAFDPAQIFITTESTSTNLTTRLTDSEINEYITTGKTSLDGEVRAEAYASAQTWMAENCWQIPIAESATGCAYQGDIIGFNTVSPMEPNLRYVQY